MCSSLDQVAEIEVDHVVTDNYIWVDLNEEVPPGSEDFILSLEAQHLSSVYRCTLFQREDISREVVCFTLYFDYTCYLNDRVEVVFWEASRRS